MAEEEEEGDDVTDAVADDDSGAVADDFAVAVAYDFAGAVADDFAGAVADDDAGAAAGDFAGAAADDFTGAAADDDAGTVAGAFAGAVANDVAGTVVGDFIEAWKAFPDVSFSFFAPLSSESLSAIFPMLSILLTIPFTMPPLELELHPEPSLLLISSGLLPSPLSSAIDFEGALVAAVDGADFFSPTAFLFSIVTPLPRASFLAPLLAPPITWLAPLDADPASVPPIFDVEVIFPPSIPAFFKEGGGGGRRGFSF